MLTRLKTLIGHYVRASNGLVGTLEDFYFDDALWVMRYLVVDVGRLLHRRKILVPGEAVAGIDPSIKVVTITPPIEQIRNSPDIDLDKPVYRQIEEQLLNYYGWVTHWTPQRDLPEPQAEPVLTGDIHLRAMENVRKYAVIAYDGRVGSIDDFIADDTGWRMPLVVLDTRHYLGVPHVVMPTSRIKGIRVEDREISVDMHKEEFEGIPCFDSTLPLEKYLTPPTLASASRIRKRETIVSPLRTRAPGGILGNCLAHIP